MRHVRSSAVGLWLCLLLCAASMNRTRILTCKTPLTWNGEVDFDYGLMCAIALVWGAVALFAFLVGGLLVPAESRLATRLLIRSWSSPHANSGTQKPPVATTATEALTALAIAAAIRLWLYIGTKFGMPTLEEIGLVRIGALALLAVSGFAVLSYVMESRFEPERTSRLRRGIASCLGLSGWFVPMVLVLVTQGVAVTWFCVMMIKGAREVWFARPGDWSWRQRVSLASALLLCWVSVVRQPGGGRQILAWFQAGLHAMPESTGHHGSWWAVIAITSLLTSLGHLSGFRPPLIPWEKLGAFLRFDARGERAHRTELAPLERVRGVVLRVQVVVSGTVALYGAARWPGNAVWCILLALTGALLFKYVDGGSLAVIVFIVVPRWTIWLLTVRQAPWNWVALCVCCEFLFLLPSIWPAPAPHASGRT
jgi:hypothetical protein